MPDVYVENHKLIEESDNRVITYNTIWTEGEPGSMRSVRCTEHEITLLYDEVQKEYYCPICHA